MRKLQNHDIGSPNEALAPESPFLRYLLSYFYGYYSYYCYCYCCYCSCYCYTTTSSSSSTATTTTTAAAATTTTTLLPLLLCPLFVLSETCNPQHQTISSDGRGFENDKKSACGFRDCLASIFSTVLQDLNRTKKLHDMPGSGLSALRRLMGDLAHLK